MLKVDRGSIRFWEGACSWVMSSPDEAADAPADTEFHAHHAVQITLPLGGSFQLRSESQSLADAVVMVAPNTRHAIRMQGTVAILFIEPESAAGRAALHTWLPQGGMSVVADPRVDELRSQLAAAVVAQADLPRQASQLGRALVNELAGRSERPPEALDPRVRKLIAWAASHLMQEVSLQSAPDLIGLSPERARHLFVEQTGLAFRTYVLWLRFMRALECIAAGTTLTESAHQAGFADSAHLSRTFRRMFGVAAASLTIS
jgi:AraC family transcriptional regulator